MGCRKHAAPLTRGRRRIRACRGLQRLAGFRPGAADAPGMQPDQGAMVLGWSLVCCAGSCPHGTTTSAVSRDSLRVKKSQILVSGLVSALAVTGTWGFLRYLLCQITDPGKQGEPNGTLFDRGVQCAMCFANSGVAS